MNRRGFVALATALLFAPLAIAGTAAGTAEKTVIAFADQSRVALTVKGNQVTAHYADALHAGARLTVRAPLAALLLKAESTRYLLHDPDPRGGLAVIIASVPSTSTRGQGYCGAGHEDYAVLIEKAGDTLAYKDRYLLQSCMQSVTLEADDPDDIRTALALDDAHFSFTYRLLGDPRQTTIVVKRGKFSRQ